MKNLLLIFSMFLSVQLVQATCSAPGSFSVSGKTSSTATLTWTDAPPGGLEYQVRYKRSDSPSWIYQTDISGTTTILSGLSAGALYQVQIATECNVANTDYSASKSLAFYTDPAYACTTPSNFSASGITSSTANLVWTPIAGSGVEYFIRYKRSTSANWIYIFDIATNSRTLSGLEAGKLYQVQLATECDENNTTTSNVTEVSFYTSPNYSCTTPSNFKVASKTSTSVNLTWNAIAGTGVEYMLRYKKPSQPSWTYIRNITTNSRTITGLTSSTLYQVQLATECDVNNSTTSATTTTSFSTNTGYACTTPTNFQITSTGSTSLDLSWSAITGTGVEYMVRYKKAIGGTWSYVRDITTTTRTITGLESGVFYQVQLATECSFDNTVTSSTVQVSGYTNSSYTCSIPTGTFTSDVTKNFVQFNWSDNPGAEYRLRYKKVDAPTWTLVSDIATNTFAVASLDSGTLYTWQVRTECSVDNSIYSDFSTLDSVLTDYGVDCESYLPISLVVDSVDFKRGYLSWSNANPFDVYNIRYRSSANPTWTEVLGSTDTEIELTNLDQGTTYYAAIQLDCSNDYVDLTSSWSDSVDFDTYLCQAPSGISGVNLGDNDGSVSWASVTGADGYNVWYSPKSAPIKDTVTTSLTTVSLSSLFAGTTYRFEIQTICSTQDALYSSFSTSLPGARNDFTTTGVSPCQVPSSFSVSSFNDNSITLGWTDSGADSYYISKRASYDADWTYINTPNPSSYIAASLDGGTLYRFRISAICSSGQLTSAWSDLLNQSTSGTSSCTVPQGVAVTNITANSADVDWSAVGAATSYTVRYKLASGNNWIYDNNVLTNFKALTSLASSKVYAVQVSSNCPGGVSSAPSVSKSFTTLSGARIASSLLLSGDELSVFPNPAQNSISLNISNQVLVGMSVEIYSSKGILVKSINSSDISSMIDVSDLSSGIYHLILRDYKTNEIEKLSFSKVD